MEKNVTYLLGAGASANAIPIVADMHERMIEVKSYFDEMIRQHPTKIDTDRTSQYIFVLKIISNDLDWLIQESGNYYTIDTLARKFYLTNDGKNLSRLKKCLITYFSVEQLFLIPTNKEKQHKFIKNPIDKRYGNFIAAITQKRYPISGGNPDGLANENLGFEINKNIKILSWNYDVQFEATIQRFTKTIINHIKREFQILPNLQSKKEVNRVAYDPNRFTMVKLNGDAIWDRLTIKKNKNQYTVFDGLNYLSKSEDFLPDFLYEYSQSDISKEILDTDAIKRFNFAWENDSNFRDKYIGHSKNLEVAEEISSDTEILVVIGYSFPVFNREIDTKLFNKMGKLKKVYIQDKYPDRIKSIMTNAFKILQQHSNEPIRFGSNYIPVKQNVEFQLEQYTDQFVIPYELNQSLNSAS